MKIKLSKDQYIDVNRKYCGYYGGHNENDNLYFENGKLSAIIYPHGDGGFGAIELTIEQTKEIYKTMKLYFEKDLIDL